MLKTLSGCSLERVSSAVLLDSVPPSAAKQQGQKQERGGGIDH